MRYLIGNWKSHKTFEQTYRWFDDFAKIYQPLPEVEVILAVPHIFIPEAANKVAQLGLERVKIAAQDVSPYPFGAYTGAVCADMLQGFASYCLVGHSERRNYFAESHLEIANKVALLTRSGIKPILCLDEAYAQKQLAVLDPAQLPQLILAYEPLEAIGTGDPDDPAHVEEVVRRLHELTGDSRPEIIYGGSITSTNAHTYTKVSGISGLLPGGSSLDPSEFASILPAFL